MTWSKVKKNKRTFTFGGPAVLDSSKNYSAHWNSPLFKLVTNLMEYSETNWMGSQFLLGGSLPSGSFMMNEAKETAVRRTQGQGKGEELSVIAEQPKNMPTETVTPHRSAFQGSAIMMQLPQDSDCIMQAHIFQGFF